MRVTPALVTAVLTLTVATTAHADGVDDLPEITDTQLADSVHDLDLRVSDLDVDASIKDLERETSGSGGEAVITLDTDILFAFGEATIGDTAADRLAELLADAPRGAKVGVVGHTDSVGSDADNQELSERRAKAVEKVLEADRPDLRVTATGKGESDPVEPNESGGKDNPEGRAQNRRVEITVER